MKYILLITFTLLLSLFYMFLHVGILHYVSLNIDNNEPNMLYIYIFSMFSTFIFYMTLRFVLLEKHFK